MMNDENSANGSAENMQHMETRPYVITTADLAYVADLIMAE